jgi:hypothetical protein
VLAIVNQAPSKLIAGAIVGGSLALLLAVVLGWHALRWLFGVPRVPRPRSTYVVLVALWAAMVAVSGAAVVVGLLLRDHQAVDSRTRLAELRCQTVTPDRVAVELTTLPGGVARSERYEMQGDSCAVSVVLVNLRPSLRLLGPTWLSRIAEVGSPAGSLVRAHVNPDWLTPPAAGRIRPLDLLIHDTQKTTLAVPAGGARFFLLASPEGASLEKADI